LQARARLSPVAFLERERARWFCWLPVALGSGIACYFALPVEPGLLTALAAVFAAAALFLATPGAGALRFFATGLVAFAVGFAAAKARTEITRAPVLGHEMRFADIRGVLELVEPRPTRGCKALEQRLQERHVVATARIGADLERLRSSHRSTPDDDRSRATPPREATADFAARQAPKHCPRSRPHGKPRTGLEAGMRSALPDTGALRFAGGLRCR